MLLLKKCTLALVLALVTACGTVPSAMPAASFITSEDSPVGTWTPSVGGTATYWSQTGTYTRTGKLVTVFCRMVINTIGTGDPGRIYGLPFPIDLDPLVYGVAAVYGNNLSTSVVSVVGLIAYGVSEQPALVLYSRTGALTTTSPIDVMGDNSAVYFSASYLTP